MANKFKNKKKNEDVVAMVGMEKAKPGQLSVKVIGRESQREVSIRTFSSAKEFVADIPFFFTPRFKAVLLFCDIEPLDFKNNLEFCKTVKAQLTDLGIPHYFVTPNEYIASHMLIQASVDIKIGESVLFLIVCDEYVSLAEREYTENGYKAIHLNLVAIDPAGDPQTMCNAIMGTSTPQKILILHRSECQKTTKFLKNVVLKSKRSLIAEVDIISNPKFILEWSKWILDHTCTKYYVLPLCNRPITISGPFEKVPLIQSYTTDPLPYQISSYVSKVNGVVTSTYTSYQLRSQVPIGILELPQHCHRVKVTLSMDLESFPSYKYDAIRLTNIENFPQMLNESLEENENMKGKVPVIGFYDDCSVICVYNEEEKSYKFLDAWNGAYGKPLALSFDAAKPLIGQDVCGKLNLNPSSVVYDLIKIMGISPDNIQMDERWPFTIKKDEKNQILFEFANPGGTRRSATPTFIMALSLKEHIKAIKTETGKDYTEFACFCFHNFTEEEEARVDKQMQAAFELLKMKCISGLFAAR